ncbi:MULTISPECIES: hypothetical protein [unclassified Yoonia]|uniref:hypothetical protein n=1 Tax=unclassified Yoonia TaxID=2629118 RepID=UPI002AFE1BFC|nr:MULTISPECIES: hypothetical protein [unclassified Yoonia]
MNRRMMFRLAGRTLRFGVYVAMEWLALVLFLVAIFQYFSNISPVFFCFMASLLVLAHNIRLSFEKPWKLLKCSIVSIVVYFVVIGVFDHGLAVVVSFGLFCSWYFWEGEQETRALAEVKRSQV